MPGPLLHVGATAQCPHGGTVQIVSSNSRVTVTGMQVSTQSDQYLVSGCSFTLPNGKPQPCVKVQWLVPAARVKVLGQLVILQSSTGLAQSAEQIPQGPPIVSSCQTRSVGT